MNNRYGEWLYFESALDFGNHLAGALRDGEARRRPCGAAPMAVFHAAVAADGPPCEWVNIPFPAWVRAVAVDRNMDGAYWTVSYLWTYLTREDIAAMHKRFVQKETT